MSIVVPQALPPTAHVGLSEVEAARRRLAHGDNSVVVRAPTPVWRRVLDQLRDPMILVLLAAAALTLVTGDVKDAVIIGSVVLVNTCVGPARACSASVLTCRTRRAPWMAVSRARVKSTVTAAAPSPNSGESPMTLPPCPQLVSGASTVRFVPGDTPHSWGHGAHDRDGAVCSVEDAVGHRPEEQPAQALAADPARRRSGRPGQPARTAATDGDRDSVRRPGACPRWSQDLGRDPADGL